MKHFLSICFLTFLMFSSSFSQENNIQKIERHYFDEYSRLSLNDEFARLDPFLISFKQYPEGKALIVLNFDKNNSRNDSYRMRKVFNYIRKRKFKKNRILFAVNKDADEDRTVLWQIFPDDDVFKFVSKNFALIKGEEFEEKLKELF